MCAFMGGSRREEGKLSPPFLYKEKIGNTSNWKIKEQKLDYVMWRYRDKYQRIR